MEIEFSAPKYTFAHSFKYILRTLNMRNTYSHAHVPILHKFFLIQSVYVRICGVVHPSLHTYIRRVTSLCGDLMKYIAHNDKDIVYKNVMLFMHTINHKRGKSITTIANFM